MLFYYDCLMECQINIPVFAPKPLLIAVLAISLTAVARVTAQMAMITAMLLAVIGVFGGCFGCGQQTTPRRRLNSFLVLLLLLSNHYCKAATIADQAEYQACQANPATCTAL